MNHKTRAMRTNIEWKGRTIEVSSRYVGFDTPFCGGRKRNHFEILVSVPYCYGRRAFISDFWQNDKKMKVTTLREALEIFCSDATSGDMTVEDFKDEFGYEDAEQLFKVYNGCKEVLVNFRHLDLDPYELGNYLREKYDI